MNHITITTNGIARETEITSPKGHNISKYIRSFWMTVEHVGQPEANLVFELEGKNRVEIVNLDEEPGIKIVETGEILSPIIALRLSLFSGSPRLVEACFGLWSQEA